MIKIIMNGCNGNMGRKICALVGKDSDAEIVAGVDMMASNATFPTFTNIDECDMPADVIIDFSTATAVPGVINYAVRKKLPLILCTTGLSEETIKMAEDASKEIALFKSANMSLGINLIANMLKKVVGILDENGFDIEITERHHNQKIDAPSGTALLLADSINEASGNKFDYVYDRSQRREKRNRKEIGITAVRGGTIVGEHSVIFAGQDEVIEFKHNANSKDVFAVGAIKAAKFIVGKPAGKYDMQDIMNEL
ncbi:MAG: 4-hydroxy-tetrahydrodipicolinate reductase [Firmicutes bacterium]|nr:4-hydroxy-tetrahydrodipicolinate reductase [Bacillota bacterium]